MSDVLEDENGRIGEIDAPASAREKTAGFDADAHESAEVGTSETPSFQDASLLDEYAGRICPLSALTAARAGWPRAVTSASGCRRRIW
jgi:hypothetical protein